MSDFKIATFNANSIRARLPIVLDWLAREKPDVLCLQETKVQDRDFPLQEFEKADYRVLFRGQKSYNGVAIISKYPFEDIRFDLSDAEEEARFIQANIKGVPIINVYVPQGFEPGSDKFKYKLRFLDQLFDLMQTGFKKDQPLIMTGDYNVALEPMDVYDPEKLQGQVGFHPEEQIRLRRLLQWGLKDIFRKHEPGPGHYTFWDYRIPNAFKRKMGWRIDYILSTAPLAKKSHNAWIDTKPRLMAKASDHTFLSAEFNL